MMYMDTAFWLQNLNPHSLVLYKLEDPGHF